MSENPEAPVSEKPKPTPPDLTTVRVKDAPAPPPEALQDGPRDLTPISWGGTYDDDADFRPLVTVPDAPDPKGLSAAGSADFFVMPDDLIPTAEDAMSSSQSEELAPTASAEKVSMPPRVPAPSKQTS